ncbi:MAG: carbon-nitrogen hydrolase family protein [candidate division WOR-3 bacterium]
MKIALAVNVVSMDRMENLANIIRLAEKAIANRSRLILFPEAALTGLVNKDDPKHDLFLGETTHGRVIRRLCRLASTEMIWLGIGFLERTRGTLYDSAVLINPRGSIVLKYRRVSPGWHGKEADPKFYRHGKDVPVVGTPFGRVGFLICRDLFDDEIVATVREKRPDLVLFPFARSFEDNRWDTERWEREEKRVYAERVKLLGATTLMVNYLSEIGGFFGGAMVVSPKGEIIRDLPAGVSGILVAEIDLSRKR